MEEYSPLSKDRSVRLSDSPAGTPRIVHPTISPIQSIHLDMMEDNIGIPPDPSPRPANFMDDASDEEHSDLEATSIPDPEQGQRHSPPLHKAENSYLGGVTASEYVSHFQESIPTTQIMAPSVLPDSYLKLTSTPLPENPRFPYLQQQPGPRPDSWYEGEITTPVATEAQSVNFKTPGSGRIVHHSSPRTSMALVGEETESSAAVVAAVEATNEAIKDIHTQTMQALLRNEDHLQSAVSTRTGRISFIPDSDRIIPHPATKKRVSMAPPPLDMSHKGSLPDEIVRTPYPYFFRKAMLKPSPLHTSPSSDRESLLALSVRRHEITRTSLKRVSKIIIPAKLEVAMVKNPNTNEKHFEALDYDDAHLFRELRKTYQSLAGPFRLFSARTLQRIEVSHSVTCGNSFITDYGLSRNGALCTHDSPRSPRFLASKGLTDSFSAMEIMNHYQKPNLGKARYAWVHWAHRITSIAPHLRSPAPIPTADSSATRLADSQATERLGEYIEDDDKCTAGLDFVEGWSLWRILMAISAVMLFAIVAAICWIFLGSNLTVTKTGYRDSGERVAGGMVIGVFVLLIGWTGVGGWIGVSWLID
jgi:hypothetical protein